MPSDDGLKLSQFARIVQACGNLLACEIGKLSQNLRGSFASGQVTQHEAHGNACSRNPRFSTENFRVAHDVLFPLHGHAPILSPFPGNRKSQFLTFFSVFLLQGAPCVDLTRGGRGLRSDTASALLHQKYCTITHFSEPIQTEASLSLSIQTTYK
jgi:hypothetical protein